MAPLLSSKQAACVGEVSRAPAPLRPAPIHQRAAAPAPLQRGLLARARAAPAPGPSPQPDGGAPAVVFTHTQAPAIPQHSGPSPVAQPQPFSLRQQHQQQQWIRQQQQHEQRQPVRQPPPGGFPGTGTVQSYESDYELVPGSELPLDAQARRLEGIIARLQEAPDVEAKLAVLQSVGSVAAFLANPATAPVSSALASLAAPQRLLLLSLPAMLQEHVLQEPAGASPSSPSSVSSRLLSLASRLSRVESFYDSMGGLLGYQLKSLQLIVEGMKDKARVQEEKAHPPSPEDLAARPPQTTYRVPRGIDLAGEAGSGVGISAAAAGLAALPLTAEIYPVGGAGDRLGLVDETTGESLPAAMLPYAGRTLMEVLLRDLQAREYLYYRLTGRQVTTPVAIMTSDAKGNHDRISGLLADLNWAGRERDSFRLFRQPMVPVVSAEDGRWLLSRPLGPMMKPGGHGAIWKLMWDEGVFDWLQNTHGRVAALVRQISNPMAGTDTTLLALAGAGFSRSGSVAEAGEAFGFMSCERAVGAAEGMNVLQERRKWVEDKESGQGRWVYEYGVTNVEYTEFARLGMSDEAVSAGSKTSVFPANTNVLFVGLGAARRLVGDAVGRGDGEQLMPGLIFNLNKKVAYTDPLSGDTRQVTAGRMESTMQNMADFMTDAFERPLSREELGKTRLSTFLVSNLRRKVTSSAKKRREPGSARIAQTPDGSFYDLQRNAWQILQRCGLTHVPEPGSPEQYLAQGPGFIFLFHPALGPLWDVISQKLMGGSLAQGAELVLEVAEARLLDVHVEGSLQVYAECVMGHLETPGSPVDAPPPPPGREGSVLSISSLRGGMTELAMPSPPAPPSRAHSPASPERLRGHASPAPGHAPGGVLRYSSRCGRVQMVNVRVRNAGIDWADPGNVYWRHQVARRETCKVVLLGQSEFEAHDVTISGAHTFVVPDGHRLAVTAGPDGALRTSLSPLARAGSGAEGFEPTWQWRYGMDPYGAVRLSYCPAVPHSPPAKGVTAAVLAAAERLGETILDFSI
ncbi:hypothetical protein HYH03_017654 [Edaphochlamys debaryana]|uniref:UGP3-like C-terminal hexapeptide repeats domain-containing protein n=1 Tax=Edaphochlamys debaryana TaxID=47281 RepID=A0A835XJL7_9CHLO|nr:hypothetical protein HYH03_017654 [Edaphochlamys debaryana]|eukprot:KAG2483471.1 hypothetical protein HYH03_017654 [Edaphochlamys debaryana]